MTAKPNPPVSTIQEWLAHHFPKEPPSLNHIARALGVKRSEVPVLMNAAPTAEALLHLNQLAQYRHLALANRVWPHCTWLDWHTKEKGIHPVIDLMRRVFGRELLNAVEQTLGRERVLDYWRHLDIPDKFDDITLDMDADDPLEDIPESQIVFNPHLEDEDVGETFVFGSAATAACFLWLIESRSHYTHYVDNVTSYTNDPLGVQLAFDLRHTLKEEYWATLPPDTLLSYLAIVRALQNATVPEAFHEGRLSPLRLRKVASLPTDRLEVVHFDDEHVWLVGQDALLFEGELVHIYVLEADSDESPAALILTTRTHPGKPEIYRKHPPGRFLADSEETMHLAFVPGELIPTIAGDLARAEDVLDATLFGKAYGVDEKTGIFCIARFNPMFGEHSDDLIPVYDIPGGYMLQFNPEYRFTPDEMAD